LVNVVRRNEDPPTLDGELGNQAVEQLLAGPIHADEGLVQEEHRRLLHEGAREEHPLALPAGERAERALLELAQADAPERLSSASSLGTSERPPPRHPRQRPHQGDVERSHRIVEPRALGLWEEATAALHANRSGGRPQQPEQHPEERRLAAAVRSEDGDPLAGAQREGDVFENSPRPVGGGELLGLGQCQILHVTLPPVKPSAIRSAFVASIPK
jgi:hypothetical protein